MPLDLISVNIFIRLEETVGCLVRGTVLLGEPGEGVDTLRYFSLIQLNS